MSRLEISYTLNPTYQHFPEIDPRNIPKNTSPVFKSSPCAPEVLDDADIQEIRHEHLECSEAVLDRGKAQTADLQNRFNWRNRMRLLLILLFYSMNAVVQAQALHDRAGGEIPIINTPTSSNHTYGTYPNSHTFGGTNAKVVNHYHHHFYRDGYWTAAYYNAGNGTSSSLNGYGWSAAPPAFSYISAREPDPEWTPMFSNQSARTKVVGASVASMRNSAGGSYIFVGPGRRNGQSSEEFTSSVKDLPPPNTISWSK